MATGDNNAFNHLTLIMGGKEIDFENDTFVCVACNGTPTATMTVPGNLTLAGNVTNQTLANVTWATTATDDAIFDADDVTFTASGGSSIITHFAIFDDTATAPVDALICWGDVDTGAANITLADTESVTLVWDATDRILRLNVT